MLRLTISLTEEQRDWVEQQADREDCSKSAVLRAVVDGQRPGGDISDEDLDEFVRKLDDGELGGEDAGEQGGE